MADIERELPTPRMAQPGMTQAVEVLPASTSLDDQFEEFRVKQAVERAAKSDFPFAGISEGLLSEMALVGEDLYGYLYDSAVEREPDMTPALFELGQVAKVAEEGGEVLKAYLRHIGVSRTPGPRSAVLEELADNVITSFVTACLLDEGSLAKAIENKLRIVYSRGWTADAE